MRTRHRENFLLRVEGVAIIFWTDGDDSLPGVEDMIPVHIFLCFYVFFKLLVEVVLVRDHVHDALVDVCEA